MQNKLPETVSFCKAILQGIDELAGTAVRIYGNQRLVQYQDAEGRYQTTDSFGVLLKNARLERQTAARAAALLCAADVPEDGVKTALFILRAILTRSVQRGCTERELEEIGALLTYCGAYLEKIATANQGVLPGGGLYLLTLVRPMRKYAREHGYQRAADVLAYALTQPLLALAEASGAEGYEVYERIKALAPNQFFSLNQVGIERSISTDSPYTDILTTGYDVRDGKIKNLSEAGIRESLASGKEILRYVAQNLHLVSQLAATL